MPKPKTHNSNDTHDSPTVDAAFLNRLVREELDRSNKYFELAQSQMKDDREYFKYLYKIAVGFLFVLVVVIGGFLYASVNEMQRDLRAGARAAVKQELDNVHAQVQDRLDKEFNNDNIANLISNTAKEAAKEHTSEEIEGRIHSEITKAVETQTPILQKAVEDQTKDAIKTIEPAIKNAVNNSTQTQIKEVVDPIQSQMKAYGDLIKMGNFVILARNDNRRAFDYLVKFALDDKSDSQNSDLRTLADSTVNTIISEKLSALREKAGLKEQQTPETLKKMMLDNNPLNRATALENYPENDKTILPTLIEIIKSDNSISVLSLAVYRFDRLTNQSFVFWKSQDLLDWWDKNKASYS
jgi:hypothetical protein